MSGTQDICAKVMYIDESSPSSNTSDIKQINLQSNIPREETTGTQPTNIGDNKPSSPNTSGQVSNITYSPKSDIKDPNQRTTNTMADGKNEARALRVLEIMNDFRTLQMHITSLVTRQDAAPPSQSEYYLDGYSLLRQCNAEAQAVLATVYNPGNLGFEPGRVPDTEVAKATLQRIILDSATRRFQAHKIYLRAAAAMRWVNSRRQIIGMDVSNGKRAAALTALDQRLRQELNEIIDQSVLNDLRTADLRKGYWIDEDPALDRMLAWTRRQSS